MSDLVICTNCEWVGRANEMEKESVSLPPISLTKIMKANRFNSRVNNAIFTCPKCKSYNLFSQEKTTMATDFTESLTNDSVDLTNHNLDYNSKEDTKPTTIQKQDALQEEFDDEIIDAIDEIIDIAKSIEDNQEEVQPENPSSQYRPKPRKVSIKCDRCNKKFEVLDSVAKKCSMGNTMRCDECMDLLKGYIG